MGGLFAFASYANQVTIEVSEFKSTLAVTQDLTGFKPYGQSLEGLSLRYKNLQGADFADANLSGADLSFATLREANLQDADLPGAKLFYATFLRANLMDATLDGANLDSAKITTPSIAGATFAGATVNRNTCWNVTLSDVRSLSPDESGHAVLETVVNSELSPDADNILGRICYRREVGESIRALAPPESDPILICSSDPFLTRGDCT